MESIIEEILTLVKKKMQEQGAYTRDAYKLEFIEDRLMEIYSTVRNEFEAGK